ncbi:MAG: HipA family kinase [Burkholderiales bacterium]
MSQPGYPIENAFIKLLPPNLRAIEAACAWIGRDMGLPLPEAVFVRVNRAVIRKGVDWPFPSPEETCFGTLEVRLAQSVIKIDSAALRSLFAGWPHLLTAAVFDHLIANDDRSAANLLLDGQNSLWLIDHSRSLGGAGRSLFSDPFVLIRNIFLEMLKAKPLAERLKMQQPLLSACAAASVAVEKVPFEGLRIEERLASQIQRFLRARSRALVAILQQELGIPDLFQSSSQTGVVDGSQGYRLQ